MKSSSFVASIATVLLFTSSVAHGATTTRTEEPQTAFQNAPAAAAAPGSNAAAQRPSSAAVPAAVEGQNQNSAANAAAAGAQSNEGQTTSAQAQAEEHSENVKTETKTKHGGIPAVTKSLPGEDKIRTAGKYGFYGLAAYGAFNGIKDLLSLGGVGTFAGSLSTSVPVHTVLIQARDLEITSSKAAASTPSEFPSETAVGAENYERMTIQTLAPSYYHHDNRTTITVAPSA